MASHLGVSIEKYFKKQQILDEIIVNLVGNEMLKEEAMEYVSKEEVSEAIKIKQMELELQREIKREKLAIETERLEIEREKRQRDREAQAYIEKEKIKHFDFSKHIRFVPPFNENEVDKFCLLFEKVAKDLDWPLNKYTILLQSVLKGKASEVYLALKPDQTSDYQTVKETILKANELLPEAFRQKFRNFKKEADKTHVEFAREKERLFDTWCMSENIGTNLNNSKGMILIEKFKNCLHPSSRNYFTEHKAQTLQKASG